VRAHSLLLTDVEALPPPTEETTVIMPVEHLEEPQWSINIDEASAQESAQGLEHEYDEWNRRFEEIVEEWASDQEVLDSYYWNYELQPHIREGEKLDEKTLSTLVTFIADSTTIAGRPAVDVFPDIQEFMLSNFDANGPTLTEKFGLYSMNLAESEFHLEGAPEYNVTADVEYELHHAVDEVAREPVTY